MQLLALTCAVALLGCGGSSSPPAPGRPTAPRTPLDRARSHELGDGVARDYAEAAKIYVQQCAAGAGDLVACRRLLQAQLAARGVTRNVDAAIGLARTLCEKRRDGHACLMLAFSGGKPSDKVIALIEEAMARPCDKQHIERCELPRDPFSYLSQSSSVAFADGEFDAEGCKLGVLPACLRSRYHEGDQRAVAIATLNAACTRGDAEACEAVDRPIDAAVLCKAHDYGACAAFGCAGDAAAAQIAADHNAPTDCDGNNAGVAGPVNTGVTPTRLPVFDTVELRPLKTAKRDGTLRYQIYNRGTKPIMILIGTVYAYDAAGKQIAREHFEHREPLQPAKATTLVTRTSGGASFEPCVELIQFEGENGLSHLARCPAQKAKGARWGDGRDNVILQINFADIPLADSWVQTLEPTLAEPFEQANLGILVRAVSGDAALMLPGAAWDLKQLVTERGPLLQLPLVRQPTAIAYRVAGVDDLQLSATTLAKIFQGQITNWNDAAIAKDNPKRTFPSVPIVVFQESSQSDQLRVTSYLASAARGVWKLGVLKLGPFHKASRFVRSYDVALDVATTEGAIAFVGAGLAEKAGMRVARIQNSRGAFVAPTSEAVTRGDYPIVSSRTLYVPIHQPDQATADAARAYATWLLTDALPIFEQIGFGREPEVVTKAGLRKLKAVTVGTPPTR